MRVCSGFEAKIHMPKMADIAIRIIIAGIYGFITYNTTRFPAGFRFIEL